MERYEEILHYWFGTRENTDAYYQDRLKLWFAGGPSTDAYIRKHFEKDIIQAAEGKLSIWEKSPRSCLALIILLDQFSLNIYRDQPRSFEQSSLAIPVSLRAIQLGLDERVSFVERVFIYLPLEHAEDLELQKQSVQQFKKLVKSAAGNEKKWMENFLDYAVKHWAVVERFGRFPDRNEMFKRESTPAEKEYLTQGGPPF